MNIAHLLSPGRTRCNIAGGSKKRVLEDLARIIAEDYPAISTDELFRQLINREKLGSTGIGKGIAIPHCRIENCSGTVGALVSLDAGIDFESIDGEPVDLIFALLVPVDAQDEHLQTLATLAQVFSDNAVLNRLRSADSDEKLYQEAVNALGDSANTVP